MFGAMPLYRLLPEKPIGDLSVIEFYIRSTHVKWYYSRPRLISHSSRLSSFPLLSRHKQIMPVAIVEIFVPHPAISPLDFQIRMGSTVSYNWPRYYQHMGCCELQQGEIEHTDASYV